MQKGEWQQIKEIFHQTLELTIEEREKLLEKQSESVRSKVCKLLNSHDKLDNFISEPIALEIGLDENSYLGKTLGNYKLVAMLGSGGMGRVFLAEKDGIDKKFALKIIKRGMDTDEVLRRFLRERKILSRLENPFIASFIDAGSTENGLPFFVMEYVEGEPLTKFCDAHQFDTKERLEIFQKVCEAVKYAHQNLIIHRDIKPSNILVTADGTPKLLDFGIAKLLNSTEFGGMSTAFQSRIFTPEYASPEQLNGLPITTATDVYSLGVVLYELLCGVRPFQSKSGNYQEIVEQILTKEPTRPSSAVSPKSKVQSPKSENATSTNDEQLTTYNERFSNPKSLKGDLDNIILKSLRKEAERRYQSVPEFVEDIRRYLKGLPVSATADSSFYRFTKFVKRNKLGTCLTAVILALSSISIWQSAAAMQAKENAEARFNQVRKLANNVLFEYQDGIRNLAGSTEIREKMIIDSAEYLDKLAAENSTDKDLQIELAKAFDRLGDVKADFSTSSIGNARAAKEFYLKALQIKEKMLMENEENLDYLEQIAESFDKLGDVEFGLGNQQTTVEYYQKAVEIRENLLQKLPENQEIRFSLMKGFRNLAVRGRTVENTETQMVLCRKALEMSENMLKNSPENAEYLEGYGDVVEGIAAILETSQLRRNEAVKEYENLIEIRRQHLAKFPNNKVLHQKYGMAYSYLGDTFFELNDLQKAIENYRKSLEILEPLGRQDQLNEPLIQDTANVRSSYAYMLAATGNIAESLESYQKIIPIFEEKFAKDETDKTTHFRIAMAKEGLAITFKNIAELSPKSKSEKSEALKKAINFYEESLAIYRIYQDRNGAFPSINVNTEQAISEVSQEIAVCREKLRKLEKQ